MHWSPSRTYRKTVVKALAGLAIGAMTIGLGPVANAAPMTTIDGSGRGAISKFAPEFLAGEATNGHGKISVAANGRSVSMSASGAPAIAGAAYGVAAGLLVIGSAAVQWCNANGRGININVAWNGWVWCTSR